MSGAHSEHSKARITWVEWLYEILKLNTTLNVSNIDRLYTYNYSITAIFIVINMTIAYMSIFAIIACIIYIDYT